MSNHAVYERIREQGWRRPLSPAEKAELSAWLDAHPEAQADWEAEAGLNQALERLPQAPVPSNFTTRVMQAVERETGRRNQAPRSWIGVWRRWMPRAALAVLLVGVALLSHQRIEHARRVEMAQSLATVADISSLPSPLILKDFDAILALDHAPVADEELLTLLQ